MLSVFLWLSCTACAAACVWSWLKLRRPAPPGAGGADPQNLAAALDYARSILAGVVDASPHSSIVAADTQGTVTLFTKGAERLLGYDSAEVVGKVVVLKFHDPQELAARAAQMGVGQSFDIFRALPSLGAPEERMWTYVRKDGRKIPVQLTVTRLLDAGGKVTGYLGIARDVSQDVALQRDRDGFFSVGQELLCKTDLDGRLLSVNPAFLRVLGYRPEQLCGHLLTDFLHPDDLRETRRCMDELGRGRAMFRFENRWRDEAGSYHYIRWHGFCPSGQDIFYGGGVDVTEEKRRDEEREEYRAYERRLMGIVSHDMRNPLTSIAMAAQLMERKPHDVSMVRRNLERIRRSCARAEALIHDLLDYAQARNAGGIRIVTAPCDLGALVQRVAEEVGLTHPQRQVNVAVQALAPVSVDAERIVQLLCNLLTNALKYSPADKPVQVRAHNAAEDFVLEVHNYGAPIPPMLLPQLFEPFSRGPDSGRPESHSVGLGLYIVREVASAHGGTVSVVSEAAHGTTFTVRLPKGPASAPVR